MEGVRRRSASVAGLMLLAAAASAQEPVEIIEVVGQTPLAFRCNCSPAVARDIVAMLGADDVDALAGEREVSEIRCSYCGERYLLTAAELRELAAELRLLRS